MSTKVEEQVNTQNNGEKLRKRRRVRKLLFSRLI